MLRLSPSTCAMAVLCTIGCSARNSDGLPVSQNPVIYSTDTTDDTATPETRDSGAADDSADPFPTGPFWMRLTLTGGDPSMALSGQALTIQTGSAQLAEDPSGFVLSLQYEGVPDGSAIVAPCVIPLGFVGGLPAQNAETSREGTDVGCPKVIVHSTPYVDNLNGLTVLTVNDSTTLEGSFTLDARSAAGHLLVGEGTFHADLCDGFWDGTRCLW